jgi:DNA polymerase
MVLVPQPEEGDAEAGRLLSGPQGRLLAAMLPHLGFAEEEVYLAAALPRAMPAPDWQALAEAGLGAVIAHHVALVNPQRLLALGGNILPLPGNNPSQTAPILPNINQNSPSVAPADLPVLCAADLGLMLDRPRSKAGFWNGWLRWTAP